MNVNKLDISLRIRDDIVGGALRFGERITIDALASRYGVSHMPVREALRELQGEGLVHIEPNRGARVRSIDSHFVENLFEIRTALEVMMARRASTRCTLDDIEALHAIENTLEQHIAVGDYARVVAENHRFHQALNRCAANVDALPIIDKHWTLLAALWRHYGYGEDRFTGVANDHRNLINALAAHDQEAASMIMGAHTSKAKLVLLARIRAQAVSSSVPTPSKTSLMSTARPPEGARHRSSQSEAPAHALALRSAALHMVRITHKTCWSFIRLHTRDGLVGEGEATLTGREDVLLEAAERLVPLALRQASSESPSGFAMEHPPADIQEASIVSALDQALWSLHAQRAGRMLAEVLGLQRTQVPVYANINRRTEQRTPDGFAASARAAMAAGYTAFKLAPFDEVSTAVCAQGQGPQAMRAGLARVAAVRETVGSGARLMVDCHWRFNEATARQLNEAAARLGVYWIECPLPEAKDNIPALARLRQQANALGMRQAGLEMGIGWDSFRPYCEAGAYDVVMPDMKYAGGIHQMQAISSGCASLGVQVSPHNPSGPICHAASLQVSATLGAFDMLELQFDESPLFDALVRAPFAPVVNGYTVLSAGSGLGVALDEAVMRQHVERPVVTWNA